MAEHINLEFTGEYAAACARLAEMATEQYERAATFKSQGFLRASADSRLIGKSFIIAIKALQGEEMFVSPEEYHEYRQDQREALGYS